MILVLHQLILSYSLWHQRWDDNLCIALHPTHVCLYQLLPYNLHFT